MTTPENADGLKDCPFCGDALFQVQGEFKGPLAHLWFHPGTVTDGKCLLSGKGYYGGDLARWNRRQPDAALVEALEALDLDLQEHGFNEFGHARQIIAKALTARAGG